MYKIVRSEIIGYEVQYHQRHCQLSLGVKKASVFTGRVHGRVYTGHGRVRAVSTVVYARCTLVRTIINDVIEAFTVKYYLLQINVMQLLITH